MLFSKDTRKARHFRIWSICVLIFVVVSASLVFLNHLLRRPSEPFVSVKFVSVKFVPTNVEDRPWKVGLAGGNPMDLTCIEVSNRMSFDVFYWIEVLHSGQTNEIYHSIIRAHSQQPAFVVGLTEGTMWA